MALGGAQAVAVGFVAAGIVGRWLGAGIACLLLAGMLVGSAWSKSAGLLALAGLLHLVIYAGLLTAFGRSMLGGRVAAITWVARRLNPRFQPRMVPYTRQVTLAWCGVFAAEIVTSGLLLAVAPAVWVPFVTIAHPVPVLIMTVAEFAIRQRRWGGDTAATLQETIMSARALLISDDGETR